MSKKLKEQAANDASEGDAIKVFVRVRPSESHDADAAFGQCLEVRLPDTIIMHSKPEPKVFTYDHVTAANTTQESVFTAVGKRIIESCVGGFNGTIFAYGQTGSGKTFTMLGPCEDGDNFHHEMRGVIPRSFEYLFSLVNREREKHGDRYEFLCRCSFLEIYNEQIYDLLDPASLGLHLRENMKKGVFVDGLIERAVASASEAYGVLQAGWHNRRVAATSMNRESSRSHAVFTVSIESKEKKAGVSNIRVSQLHLVDLAGSERQKDTKAIGVRLKEAGSINKSLSILGNVIMALVDIAHGKQRHVPYRDSKLSFLLRDSLGGNAKTYIIANVHPDAKCFGETLSTLKFARRAKMIKNRAVVNEDTQGNVMHLQAEIRRLREALCMKGAEGSIPRGPSESGDSQMSNSSTESNGPVSGQQSGSSSSSKWKKYFLEAMSLRDIVEVEKREMREKVSSLEELCSKRDQVISSNKMIIKFRNSTIDMLQKTKNKALLKEDRDLLNENLKKEIEQLQEQLEHNPFVMRYVVENQSLRAQNKKLKMMEAVRSGEAMAATKAEELETLFLELREGLSKNRRYSSTPVDGEKVPTSTLVILKSQIKKLQDELENAKQEHAEQEEMTRTTRLDLESELAAYKKANLDMEKTLQGMKIKNRMDRDAMNDIHMQTIKSITTPKKVTYQLRSRTVLRTAGEETPGGPGFAGLSDNGSPLRSHSTNSLPPSGDILVTNSSPAMSEEGIIDEEMPEHVIEQCNEALTIELQKLQDKNANLQQQLEEHESQKHKMLQNSSKLDHQLQQITELYSTESQAWQEHEKDLTTRLAEATIQISTLQRDYEMTRGEAEDFKVMLQAADKEIGQEKKQKSKVTQDWDRVRAALDAQVVRLENEMCGQSRELENLTEDREQLQDAYNTLQAEHEFQQQREADLENRLKGKKAEITQLQEEIQKHLEKLDSERDKSMRLTAELRQGDNTKKDLLDAQELIDQFREERDDLLHRLDTEALKLSSSKEDLETVNSALTAIKKTDVEQKEALSSLMAALQGQKGMVKDKEEQLASMQMQLEDTRGQVSLLEAALEEGKASGAGLQSQIAALEDRMHAQAGEYQEQIEQMRADAMDANQHQKELLKELEKQSEELTQLHKQMKEKEEEYETKESEHKDTIESLEEQLEEVKTNLSTVVVELDEPESKKRKMADAQAMEIESLRDSEKRFKELSSVYDNMRDQMNEEIRSLKMKADELEDVRISKEILQAQHTALTYEIEQVRNEMAEKESSLKDEVNHLKRDMERQKTVLASMLRDKDEAVEKLYTVQTTLDQVKANEEILQENMDQVMEELDRTSALESTHFKEKEDIKSKLEEEREEKSKLTKDLTRLKEVYEEAEKKITELGGHQNPKQKIHHLQAVKSENYFLKEEVESLEKQLGKAQSDSEQMKRDYEALQKRLTSSSAEPPEEAGATTCIRCLPHSKRIMQTQTA
uniref:Kinesin-like protein KIF15 n=1 Tax=Strongylocentrotus purpuratus TaxID=7668 RepID=KIF15_STRPU|nr:RecName: Full=Kinesin-like protein KIF15; AltName: Full=Kinesin-related protein KRP180 [Strongylocentrotus purpuratus]AAG01844.1 kinesin-like protein KRP180 [Strongylocentrotus purpuratus]